MTSRKRRDPVHANKPAAVQPAGGMEHRQLVSPWVGSPIDSIVAAVVAAAGKSPELDIALRTALSSGGAGEGSVPPNLVLDDWLKEFRGHLRVTLHRNWSRFANELKEALCHLGEANPELVASVIRALDCLASRARSLARRLTRSTKDRSGECACESRTLLPLDVRGAGGAVDTGRLPTPGLGWSWERLELPMSDQELRGVAKSLNIHRLARKRENILEQIYEALQSSPRMVPPSDAPLFSVVTQFIHRIERDVRSLRKRFERDDLVTARNQGATRKLGRRVAAGGAKSNEDHTP